MCAGDGGWQSGSRRHTDSVWTYLENWIVQDGEVRELGRGQRLTDVGMRAGCWNIREAVGTAGVTGLPGPDPDGFLTRHCEVAGAVEWTRAPSTVLLRVNGFRLIAEPSGVREVRVRDGEYALERYLPDFWLPRVGSRVSLHCQLSVMADYEWDAFEFPDVRADWVVERIQVEHREHLLPEGLGAQGGEKLDPCRRSSRRRSRSSVGDPMGEGDRSGRAAHKFGRKSAQGGGARWHSRSCGDGRP